MQGHVETLWRLLERYEIPVFLFVNKMDQPGTDRTALMQELEKRLDGRCMDFEPLVRQKEPQMVSLPEEFLENLAMSDEETLEYYLENGTIETEQIAGLISQRKVFPCYFGSALKMQGVEDLLAGMHDYMQAKEYGSTFGARVFKITRDAAGQQADAYEDHGRASVGKGCADEPENRDSRKVAGQRRSGKSEQKRGQRRNMGTESQSDQDFFRKQL